MRFSIPLIFAGTALYSGAVWAVTPAGPTWELIGIASIGLLISGVGWYARGVSSRVAKVEERLNELNHAMLRDYHPKADIKELLDEIKYSINSLHAKFEKFEGLYGR